jgi:hypothetical protein
MFPSVLVRKICELYQLYYMIHSNYMKNNDILYHIMNFNYNFDIFYFFLLTFMKNHAIL